MTKVRPIPGISDFVRTDFPILLETDPSALPTLVDTLVTQLSQSDMELALMGRARLVASLDLKMLEAGIHHSGFVPTTRLTDIIGLFSGDNPQVLLYEEIIIENPVDDTRTFTRGEVGETERVFYSEHRLVEINLDSVIESTRRAIYRASIGDGDGAGHALAGIRERLDLVVRATAKLGRMPREHFTAFRLYLGAYPDRGLKGPSGAFSATIPLLEILLRGDELDAKYLNYLAENRQYLPRRGREAIDGALSALSKTGSLTMLWRANGQPAALGEQLSVMRKFFDGFRRVHYRSVERQLPEAITDDIPGTGGETKPGEFLRERIRSTSLRGS